MVKKLRYTADAGADTVRLDLGAGKCLKTPAGFEPVDLNKFPKVQQVDLRDRWPWKNNSVDEVHCDYLIQYFSAFDRMHFVNELYRVLKPGGTASIITPYWCANKAYMDIAVHWPPIVEGWYATLSKSWREQQNYVDMSGYTCDFDYVLGYGMHHMVVPRAQEYQQHAVTFFKEAAQDLHATLTKKA